LLLSLSGEADRVTDKELTTLRLPATRFGSSTTVRAFWNRLVEPAQGVRGAAARRRARFLSLLLATVGPVAWLFALFYDLGLEGEMPQRLFVLHIATGLGLALAYFVSRTERYQGAVVLTAGCAVAGSWMYGLAETDPVRLLSGSAFALSGILLCAVFFPLRITVGVAVVNLLAMLGILLANPAMHGGQLLWSLTIQAVISAMIVLISDLSQKDLAHLTRSRDELARSEERFSLAARGANDGLWDWDLRDGTTYFSPRWATILGLRHEELVGTMEEWLSRVHPEDIEALRAEFVSHRAGTSEHFQHIHRVAHKDGVYRWVLARGLAVRDVDGEAVRVAGSLTDITERKRYEEQLLHDAFHDHLTGLANRALFLNRLAHSVARARRRPSELFAVLFLDLDGFKVVNDSLGHFLGDELLVGVARRLEQCIRPGDTVARLGGDEFTVLLEEIAALEEAEVVAERICTSMQPSFNLGGQEVSTSASIGIALSSGGYGRPEDLIRDADTAMYSAKAEGRARVRIFDRTMHENAVARLKLENDLSRALSEGQLRLNYQPIICLQSGGITGFEALLRWQHPERGLVFPGEFIAVAEETGMIDEMGWWVLDEACASAARWRSEHPEFADLQLNVNLSGRQFRGDDLPARVVEITTSRGLDPAALRLEITETVVMEDAQSSREVLAELQGHGIGICIDDFGTGYSSLNYLHAFDVDVLKIDRSFVRRVTREHRPEIISTILELSRSMGLTVTAEGVETREQLLQLRELNCDRGQGYYFARALAPEEVSRLLARKPIW
jgi:diguanylate cyclase (GGDEF)-like protein/PAS domain S-box-containing protein